MNDKNNSFILTDLIEFVTEKVLNLINKAGKLISNRKKHDIMEMGIKIIVMFLFILILKIPFNIISKLGVILIYKVASIFRYYLSVAWVVLTMYSFYILSLIIIYKVFNDIFKNKELNILEDDRKKDKKVKKIFFTPILRIIRTIIILMLLPILGVLILLFAGLGMASALLVNGTFLISIFIILIGLIIIFYTSGYTIIRYIFNSIKNYKKYIEILFAGFAIFIFGILAFWFETISFSYSNTLPVNFASSKTEISIKYDKNNSYIISKGKNNDNIIINKSIDNSLKNEIVIKGEYLETSTLSYYLTTLDNKTNIAFYNDMNLDNKKIEKIYNLLIDCIVNKTIYNFKDLKYSTIEIYANEKVLEDIIIANE